MKISNAVTSLLSECTRVRRDLHKIPETAFTEVKTQRYILDYLEKLRPDSIETLALTGVKAVFYAKNPQKTIALRADIDALDTTESNDTDYKSEHIGKMHGCGHDGHITMLLMTARLIAASRDKLKYNIVLLFQPGEEGRGGAKRMIADKALENPLVDVIYGCHLWPAIEKGKLGVRWGVQMAQTCELDFTVHGLSAHGASPQMGVDAVVAAAEFISILQTAITRSVDPHQDALLTIGRISGGTARNIISDKVEMNATIRVLKPEVYTTLMNRIEAIAEGIGLALGAKFEINELMQYPSVNNPRPLVEDFYSYAPMEDIVLIEPSMAGEDFAFYQKKIDGLFFFLGIGGGKNKFPLHNDKFDFDEDALLYGIEVYSKILGL